MSNDQKLKEGFGNLFPEYAAQLDAAGSMDELNSLYDSFVQEARDNLAVALKSANSNPDDTDHTATILLKSETYKEMIGATGHRIENLVHELIDGLARLKGMDKDDAAFVTAQLMLSGALSVGTASTNATLVGLGNKLTETFAAVAGVEAATVTVVCAVVVLVIVLIVIPILYFMKKPANCFVLLINELDAKIEVDSDFNVHGKPVLMTSPLREGSTIGDKKFATAGLICTSKRDNALVGTQYGFVMKYKDKKLSFGVENPLSDLGGSNNCYCSFGESAENAAKSSAKHGKQEYTASKDGIKLSIRCSSASGSNAFYIARAYKD